MISGGIFDVADKENLLVDINNKLSEESTWSNLDLSQNLNKEKADLEKFLDSFLFVDETINDNLDLLEIAIEESTALPPFFKILIPDFVASLWPLTTMP